MEENIHVAITRTVKAGFEEPFEQAIQDFFAKTMGLQGSLGVQLIRPVPGSGNNSYGILRSFKSEKDRQAFYASAAFMEWEKVVEPMVEGEYTRKDLHGLEAFFSDPNTIRHPPKWKMAFVTWLGVWPTVFAVTQLLSPHLSLPVLAATGVDTFVVVVILSWAVMPLLTKIMRPWLRSKST
ncbi:MAG: hypothetical protein QNJ17_02340 [Desulfocapsaceae bacterium]|nr:hypothetical protein [Desulfocapsaceae bacterium]